MTHHKHTESHPYVRPDKNERSDRKFHKDWRVWLVVGIMLLAIATYVLTLDDSIIPAIMGR